mmetsp:Transcript_6990/g.21285  ORF Transcript_6990/g.21285 Transcript_6990/m.21285 type:complete len:80 (+) Transcript_6990:1846-2085(+)
MNSDMSTTTSEPHPLQLTKPSSTAGMFLIPIEHFALLEAATALFLQVGSAFANLGAALPSAPPDTKPTDLIVEWLDSYL